jgi:VWFA-related protein
MNSVFILLKRTSVCLAVPLFLSLGHPAVLSAQEPAQKVLKHEVTVAVKLIQVSVTDKQGKPATDLTAADFQVTDNGKPVKIGHFEKHVYGGRDEFLPALKEAARPLSRKFFLIFDFAFIDPASIGKAKNAALHFIDTVLQPTDEISLVSYSPQRGLTLHEYLTSEHGKVRQIIENFGLRRVTGRAENLFDFYLTQRQIEIADASVRAKGDPGTVPDDPWLDFMARSRIQPSLGGQKESYINTAIRFSQALKNLAQTFRSIPGTKNILFFSNGIARQVLYGKGANALKMIDNWSSPEQLNEMTKAFEENMPDSSVRGAYTDMLSEFRAANCPVYSFNEARVGGGTAIESTDGWGTGIKELTGDDALKQFASVTGGKYYSNTMNYMKAVEDIKNITGVFYVLGYTVDEKWDGAYHKVKVKTVRKGVNVSAQAGYFNLKPFASFTGFEKLLHLMDVALAENPQYGLPAEISFTPVPVRAGNATIFSAYARLSSDRLKEILGKRAEAYFLFFDDKQNVLTIKRFSVDALPADREGLLLDFSFPTGPGSYEGRLVVRNLTTGLAARGTARFAVPKADPTGPWLDPLLLLEEGRNFLALSATQPLSLNKMYGYDPNTFFPRTGEFPVGTQKITAAVRCGGFRDGQDLAFIGSVVNTETQVRTNAAVSIVDRTQSGEVHLARIEINPGDLPAGKYSLEIVVRSQNSGMAARASSPITVK